MLSGTDGGVTSVSFSPLNYSGTVAVVNEGGGLYSVTDQLSDIVGTATPTGAGSASSINLTGLNGANTTGTCNVSGANVTCGLVFGAGVGFPVDVNGNTRYFRQTVNFSAIPEPGTALLIGLGLTGLAARRRPRPTAV